MDGKWIDAVKSMVGEGDKEYEVRLQPKYRGYKTLDAGKDELEEKLRSKIKENKTLIAENPEVKEMIKRFNTIPDIQIKEGHELIALHYIHFKIYN
jgi:hypothetical protein